MFVTIRNSPEGLRPTAKIVAVCAKVDGIGLTPALAEKFARRARNQIVSNSEEMMFLTRLRNCREITCPFRMTLALPVAITRRGHSNSALAEPAAHGTKRHRISFQVLTSTTVALVCWCALISGAAAEEKRPHVKIRGIYGGVPVELLEQGKTLEDFGVNAIFMGSGGLTAERINLLKKHDAKVYAEFNTMHVAAYLKDHPDAAPIGVDGKACPAPHDWQGICPTHPGYRKFRMEAFRKVLGDFEIDGIWLDYHHSHASWERAVPNMPDTCFCERCIGQFARETKTDLPHAPPPQLAKLLLGKHSESWVQWRCDVFTDWVREFRSIISETRPTALLGTFHCPWTDADYGGALRNKLAIDLKAQAEYVDVFSIMPYHARFGHQTDPSWISRQTAWLGEYLGIQGAPGERHKIWPIVQLSDWGETVSVDQVRSVLDHGMRSPATGVMVFNWGSLRRQTEKVDEMSAFYRAVKP